MKAESKITIVFSHIYEPLIIEEGIGRDIIGLLEAMEPEQLEALCNYCRNRLHSDFSHADRILELNTFENCPNSFYDKLSKIKNYEIRKRKWKYGRLDNIVELQQNSKVPEKKQSVSTMVCSGCGAVMDKDECEYCGHMNHAVTAEASYPEKDNTDHKIDSLNYYHNRPVESQERLKQNLIREIEGKNYEIEVLNRQKKEYELAIQRVRMIAIMISTVACACWILRHCGGILQ